MAKWVDGLCEGRHCKICDNCGSLIPTDTQVDFLTESDNRYCYCCGKKMVGEDINVPTNFPEVKNMKWRPYYYIFKNTGEKMQEGWVCSVCGKHSYSRKEVCDGCNTTMWKVEIR